MTRADYIFPTETLRYPKPARPGEPHIDGLKNFHFVTRGPDPSFPMVQLESGINPVAATGAGLNRRRPAILIRSSPWKAGTADTPWEDVFELQLGRITYFGDHRPDSVGPLGSTPGNQALRECWALHRSGSRAERLAAPPLLMFRAETWSDLHGKVRQKGAVEFCGVGRIQALPRVVCHDRVTGRDFPNYRADIEVVQPRREKFALDWAWINARRDPRVSLEQALPLAPTAWQEWVDDVR